MATKTFKIGEYANGGVITVETTKNTVVIITKQWDTSAGYTKSSNQSNAKELYRFTSDINDRSAEWNLFNYLSEQSTSYYADQIMKWIKSKVKLKEDSMWF